MDDGWTEGQSILHTIELRVCDYSLKKPLQLQIQHIERYLIFHHCFFFIGYILSRSCDIFSVKTKDHVIFCSHRSLLLFFFLFCVNWLLLYKWIQKHWILFVQFFFPFFFLVLDLSFPGMKSFNPFPIYFLANLHSASGLVLEHSTPASHFPFSQLGISLFLNPRITNGDGRSLFLWHLWTLNLCSHPPFCFTMRDEGRP